MYLAWTGVKKIRNTIMMMGARDMYMPNGASAPSSYVIIFGIMKNSSEKTILAPTMTKLNDKNRQKLPSTNTSCRI